MDCDYCIPTNIVAWSEKKAEGTPDYWCKKHNKFCNAIDKCEYKAEKGQKADAN